MQKRCCTDVEEKFPTCRSFPMLFKRETEENGATLAGQIGPFSACEFFFCFFFLENISTGEMKKKYYTL